MSIMSSASCRLVFAINHVLTDAEEIAAREYLTEAGYEVLKGYLPSKTSYRDAQNHGRSVTETRYDALNSKAGSSQNHPERAR